MTALTKCRPRRGLSKIELLGCLGAVAGGVWIGAQYLNLDLHGAAYQALDETELLTRIPEEWRPVNPDCPDGDCPSKEEVRVAELTRLRSELEDLRFEVARLAWNNPDLSEELAASAKLSDEQIATRDRTQAYWQDLTQIVFDVTSIQERVAPFTGTAEHSRALAVRRRALEYGQHAAGLLSPEGVDPQAVATGVRISEWLGHGAQTLQQALELRGSQAVAGRAVPAAAVWAQTEAELQKRTELVRRKSRETAAYLTTRYFVAFPPLDL